MIRHGIGQVSSAMRTMMLMRPGPTNAATSSSRIEQREAHDHVDDAHDREVEAGGSSRRSRRRRRPMTVEKRADTSADHERHAAAEQRPREDVAAERVRARTSGPRSAAGGRWRGPGS